MHQHETGLQLHNANLIDMTSDSEIQRFLQILFYTDDEYCHGVYEKLLVTSGQLKWSKMETHRSGYRGYQAICRHCGAVAWAAWTPASTKGWRDQQRANILSFLGLPGPQRYMDALETELPMV